MFSGDAFSALQKGLSAASLRQQVIAHNVANINTPGYKRQDVTFEEEFGRALNNSQDSYLRTTNERHSASAGSGSLGTSGARVITQASSSLRYDGNNVDVDEEMSKLAENNIRFNAMAQLVAGRFSTLKTVINEGRR